RLRGDVEDVRQQPPDLAIEHTDELAAARHRKAEQPLDREAERVLLVHRRDVVEPVEIRDRLLIDLVLDQLMGASVKKSDVRINPFNNLAVQFKNQAQDAMRRRMLRPKIDRKISKSAFSHVQLGFGAFSSPGST